eukprot:TRINITY_DN27941_c0_g1_i1.p1 TRINITY_DN27941_c0_g1~~TRINITY_DN27941_c0_g1_i1.p1  ORF type:complete len:632 (+),score=270.17 TRINITY_DN27941_c0_g1_i1:179-1897(+)
MVIRVKATKQLKVIAEALGFKRTRDELIPYLTEKGGGWDDDDEVLVQLAAQFSDFLDYVGGPEYAETLLSPLEHLVGMEEPAVRQKAVSAIIAIVSQLSDRQIERDFAPMVTRMANHDWSACKAGSAALIPHLYTRIRMQDVRETLVLLYSNLCRVEEPMVKRAAAENMAEFVKAVREPNALRVVLPLYSELGSDKQDGVRLLVVEKSSEVARQLLALPHCAELVQEHVVPIVREAAQDPSWRVRYMLCNSFKAIVEASGLSKHPAELTELVRVLAEDKEAEVRTAVAHQISNIGLLLVGTRELRSVTPHFRDLCSDANNHVRAAAAANIVGLAQILPREEITTLLLPIVQKLLQDESSEVRLNVIGELGKVSDGIGFKELSKHILPAVTNLATDTKWRVREGVVNVVPSLAKLMGPEAFEQELSKIVVGWLTDQVCEIRTLVAKVLCDLWDTFGEQWGRTALVKKVGVLANKENYMHRVALLYFLGCVAKSGKCSDFVINTDFLPYFQLMARDKVPNVRFNVAKAIELCLPKIDPQTSVAKWKPLLDELENDSDHDVKHFARKALVQLREM